jgi:drug/metabolite transporter (DMT)-like permease
MVVAFALLSALLYAVASVAQQRAASDAPADQSLRLGLLVHLVRRPVWVAGIVADVAAFACQFAALRRGSLVVVQPLLVCGLLFALPLGAALTHQRFTRAEWLGTAAVVAGLSLFLVVSGPARGRAETTGLAWAVIVLLTVLPTAALVLAALDRRRSAAMRAGLLAAAAGVVYGLTAALTKTSAHLLDRGLGHVLTAWQPYALAAAGLAGMVLAQSAFQAGPLAASLPVLTVADPVVSIVIGAAAFHEGLHASAGAVAAEAAGLALIVAGVVVLARSPLVAAVHDVDVGMAASGGAR